MVNKSYSKISNKKIQYYNNKLGFFSNPNGQCQILLEKRKESLIFIKYRFNNNKFTLFNQCMFYDFVKDFYKW